MVEEGKRGGLEEKRGKIAIVVHEHGEWIIKMFQMGELAESCKHNRDMNILSERTCRIVMSASSDELCRVKKSERELITAGPMTISCSKSTSNIVYIMRRPQFIHENHTVQSRNSTAYLGKNIIQHCRPGRDGEVLNSQQGEGSTGVCEVEV